MKIFQHVLPCVIKTKTDKTDMVMYRLRSEGMSGLGWLGVLNQPDDHVNQVSQSFLFNLTTTRAEQHLLCIHPYISLDHSSPLSISRQESQVVHVTNLGVFTFS